MQTRSFTQVVHIKESCAGLSSVTNLLDRRKLKCTREATAEFLQLLLEEIWFC